MFLVRSALRRLRAAVNDVPVRQGKPRKAAGLGTVPIEALERRVMLATGTITKANTDTFYIPDDTLAGQGVVHSDIAITTLPTNAVITNVSMSYKIQHTWIGDLVVWMGQAANTTPGSNDRILWNLTGGRTDNLDQTVANIPNWNGLAANTTFSLMVDDQVAQDTGYIYDFRVSVSWRAPDSQIDLMPTTPAGWAAPVVVNATPGSRANVGTYFDNQDLFVSYAITNNYGGAQPQDCPGTFYSWLYVDGVYKGQMYTRGLAVNAVATPYLDFNIGKLAAGVHTVRLVADGANIIPEYSDANNSYTITFRVEPSTTPDLMPFKLANWSNHVVVATSPLATTDAATIYTDQSIYLTGAIRNASPLSITNKSFVTSLLVDGVVKGQFTRNVLGGLSWVVVTNGLNIGTLSAGTHTVQLQVDSGNTINEGEFGETNNIFTRTFTVLNRPKADLTYTTPAGWSEPIVVSTQTGDRQDAKVFRTTDDLFLDVALINAGNLQASGTFYTQIYVDGVYKGQVGKSSLAVGTSYVPYTDFKLYKLSAGQHTIQMRIDAYNVIGESNEANNTYTKTITVLATTAPDLTPYRPTGWSDRVVVTTQQNSVTDSATIYENQAIYVNTAMINVGAVETGATLYNHLFLDGRLINTNAVATLALGASNQQTNISLGTLAAGTHTLTFVTDATNTIREANEANNTYTKTFTVAAVAKPDLAPYAPPFWSDALVASNTPGDPINTFLYDDEPVYISGAIRNQGTADITNTSFDIKLYVDGELKRTATRTTLAAGTSTTPFVDYYVGLLSEGIHEITMVIDSGNTITELNEGNNTITLDVEVFSETEFETFAAAAPLSSSPANPIASGPTTQQDTVSQSILGTQFSNVLVTA